MTSAHALSDLVWQTVFDTPQSFFCIIKQSSPIETLPHFRPTVNATLTESNKTLMTLSVLQLEISDEFSSLINIHKLIKSLLKHSVEIIWQFSLWLCVLPRGARDSLQAELSTPPSVHLLPPSNPHNTQSPARHVTAHAIECRFRKKQSFELFRPAEHPQRPQMSLRSRRHW